MIVTYLALIFLATLAGGFIPVVFKKIKPDFFFYLLAFTGAFLFGITVLHLVPETFHELGRQAGVWIVAGFFLQVFLQQLSHGMEHGHSHIPAEQHHHAALSTLMIGLSLHAFMEGIPLGYRYDDPSTLPSLFLAIMVHKVPEALTLMTVLIFSLKSRKRDALLIVLFALVTPAAAVLALALGERFASFSHLLLYLIAMVTGAFLHISTTIFFESGTRHHELSWRKTVAIVTGLLMALCTLLIE